MCPVHSNGSPGHDDWLPTRTFMALVNSLFNILDKRDCEGIFFFFFFVMQHRRRCFKQAVPSGLNQGYESVPTATVEPRDL